MHKKSFIACDFVWCISVITILSFLGIRNFPPFINSIRNIFVNNSTSVNEELKISQSQKDRMDFIHLNGFVAKLMNQKVLNQIVKDKNNQLYRIGQELKNNFDIDYENNSLIAVNEIFELCRRQNIDFLYVERPIKSTETSNLPYGYNSNSIFQQKDYRQEYFTKNNIPYLDIGKTLSDKLKFYKTDHHWTVESAFYSAIAVEKYLQHRTDIYNKSFIDFVYKSSLLGSGGIRVGKYFAGMDDVIIPVPNFETDFNYKHYINDKLKLEKNGPFKESLLNVPMLEDKKYYNKYYACLNASDNETIIINKMNNSDSKCLVISDSFGRSMVMYTCLNYYETRYLDPQQGRYNKNYLDYIKNYQPDVVIIMTPVEINIQS